MDYQTLQKTRIQHLNDAEILKGKFVLYWMQQSQRPDYNHALEYAVQQANRLGQGVVVAFGLMDDYPEANLRHYTFMLEGLKETQAALVRRGRQQHPPALPGGYRRRAVRGARTAHSRHDAGPFERASWLERHAT